MMKAKLYLMITFTGFLGIVIYSLFFINKLEFTGTSGQHKEQAGVLGAFSWPANSQWSIVTAGGGVMADWEERGTCADSTRNTAVSGEMDIGSQARCATPQYNPGNNGQPGATPKNTFSASFYYDDASGDSTGCTNINDDSAYFRMRLAGNPMQSNPAQGLKNFYWWVTLDDDSNGIPDFYIILDGSIQIMGEFYITV